MSIFKPCNGYAPWIRDAYPHIPWTEELLESFFVNSERKIRFNLKVVEYAGRMGEAWENIRLAWCIPKKRFDAYIAKHPEVREAFDAGVAQR
jgi:hypothetical protein